MPERPVRQGSGSSRADFSGRTAFSQRSSPQAAVARRDRFPDHSVMADTKVSIAQRLKIVAGSSCENTGPGTPAGRYLRSFWQPVYHSADLKPGRPVPLRIMSEDFTLYRGESTGAVHLVE